MIACKQWTNVVLCLTFASCLVSGEHDVAKYCKLVPTETKFPNLESCEKFFQCLSLPQVIESSCPAKTVFDKDSQACVSASSSNCSPDVSQPCENKNGIWAVDGKDCHIWHYCSKGSIAGSGTCPVGHYFNDSVQMCVNGDCSNTEDGVNVTDIKDLCHIMQNGQFFGDFNNCAVWHRCSGSNMDSGTCKSGLIYDAEKRMCLPSGDNMCAGPAEKCEESIENKEVANPNVCSIYFQCTQSNSLWLWTKIQCPPAQYYDILLKTCTFRQAATPIESCNRCEATTKTWVNAVNPNCNTYLTCRSGQMIGNGSCPSNTFFDEQSQMCRGSVDDLPEYRKTNGACNEVANVTTDAPTEKPLQPTEKPSTTPTDAEESTTGKSESNGTESSTAMSEESTTAQSEGGDKESTTTESEGNGDKSTTAKTEGDGEESTTSNSGSNVEESSTTKSEGDGEKSTTTKSENQDSTTDKSEEDGKESTTAKTEGDGAESTTIESEGNGEESTTIKFDGNGDKSTTATTESDGEESTTSNSGSNVEESSTTKSEGDGEKSTTNKSENQESTTVKSEEDGEESTTAKTEGDDAESTTVKSEENGEESTTAKMEGDGAKSTTIKSEEDGEESTTAKTEGDAKESTTIQPASEFTTFQPEGNAVESTTAKSGGEGDESTIIILEGNTAQSTTIKPDSEDEGSTTASSEGNVK